MNGDRHTKQREGEANSHFRNKIASVNIPNIKPITEATDHYW